MAYASSSKGIKRSFGTAVVVSQLTVSALSHSTFNISMLDMPVQAIRGASALSLDKEAGTRLFLAGGF